ncbi:helix-turn-helix domain-containing protein [Pseudomonas sp. PSKL.D1]|uniref:helix-turn-helix domain-containing protein n=1 Tax=Pseudomonas sp. PSKL.D1 TaxID=3029060 RepID=UPI0023815EDF|nr:helix-turn-helix transcriptional regulator [Pseudomonas sp. PSKL.D1]WDY59620.1 helix-turn-helix transcriptional regulator [Pseudomonas sp. PSKL.D1]
MNAITPERRKQLIEDIMQQHERGNETLGASIRRLRLEVTGFDQQTFATMCNMSIKALYLIENDKGNPTLSTIEDILRKFGLRLGLTMRAPTTYTPPLGQHTPVAKSPARGASPKRTSAGRATSATTRRAAAQTRNNESGKGLSD